MSLMFISIKEFYKLADSKLKDRKELVKSQDFDDMFYFSIRIESYSSLLPYLHNLNGLVDISSTGDTNRLERPNNCNLFIY